MPRRSRGLSFTAALLLVCSAYRRTQVPDGRLWLVVTAERQQLRFEPFHAGAHVVELGRESGGSSSLKFVGERGDAFERLLVFVEERRPASPEPYELDCELVEVGEWVVRHGSDGRCDQSVSGQVEGH